MRRPRSVWFTFGLLSLALIFVVLQRRYRLGVLALIIMGAFRWPGRQRGCALARWLTFVVASMMGFRNACRYQYPQWPPEDQQIHQSGGPRR